MTLTLPAFLDALTDELSKSDGELTNADMVDAIRASRAALKQHPTPAPDHWSDWLDWAGGPCPLPDTTGVEVELVSGVKIGRDVASARWWAHNVPSTGVIKRFRYRTDDPSGWLPRGDFVPPAALWDEACPVRCEWTRGLHRAAEPGRNQLIDPAYWEGVTHIRLLPREKAGEACEMPDQDGWSFDMSKAPSDTLLLVATQHGAIILDRKSQWFPSERWSSDFEYDPEFPMRISYVAWQLPPRPPSRLASMKERGNG